MWWAVRLMKKRPAREHFNLTSRTQSKTERFEVNSSQETVSKSLVARGQAASEPAVKRKITWNLISTRVPKPPLPQRLWGARRMRGRGAQELGKLREPPCWEPLSVDRQCKPPGYRAVINDFSTSCPPWTSPGQSMLGRWLPRTILNL